jgi:long-subunit fatty acid transport protein
MKRFACLVALCLLAAPALAQNTDIESLAGLTFNFRNPGARSLAMGGAFLGLADDATAAETNPAGLTILRQSEVSLELRNYRSETLLPASGDYPDLEDENFVSYSRNVDVSFASAVFAREKWAMAVYYHHPLQVSTELNMVYGFDAFNDPFLKDLPYFYVARGTPIGSGGAVTVDECERLQNEDFGACSGFQVTPFFSTVSVDQETWGLAGAWEFGRLSVGGGLRYQTFEQGALTLRYDENLSPLEALIQATELDDNGDPKTEDDVTLTAGFKFALRENLAIGGVIKQGAEYPTGVFQSVAGEEFDESFDTTFHVPDTAGIGVSWRPIPVLALLADAVWIRYSNLTDDFRSAYAEIQLVDEAYAIEDAAEYHVGAEYFFTSRIPVAVRAGWWLEPAHGLDYVGPLTCTDAEIVEDDRVLCSANRIRSELLFTGGEEQNHFTVGVGLAWPRFQIDAAYDTSDNYKVGSLSGVFRF